MNEHKKRLYREGDFDFFIGRLLKEARKRSKSKNRKFKLTKKQIFEKYKSQDGKCALTGRDINFKDGYRLSIDRIDPKGIYEKNNIQLVCKEANFAKHALTSAEFIVLCQEVVNYANINANKIKAAKRKKVF